MLQALKEWWQIIALYGVVLGIMELALHNYHSQLPWKRVKLRAAVKCIQTLAALAVATCGSALAWTMTAGNVFPIENWPFQFETGRGVWKLLPTWSSLGLIATALVRLYSLQVYLQQEYRAYQFDQRMHSGRS